MFDDGPHPLAVLLGIAAGIWTFYVSGTMGAGFIMKTITFVVVTIIGTIMANAIFNKG